MHLLLREPISQHLVEQCVRQIHIVDAVVAVLGQLPILEVCAAVTLKVVYLCALHTQAVPLGQGSKRTAHLHTVNSSPHAQGVCPKLRTDIEVLVQDKSIKHNIMCQPN